MRSGPSVLRMESVLQTADGVVLPVDWAAILVSRCAATMTSWMRGLRSVIA